MDSTASLPSIERQLALLAEASATLLAWPESPTVIQTILDLATRFIEADAYSIWRRRSGEDKWDIVAAQGLSESYGRTIIDNRQSEWTAGKPVVIESLGEVPFPGRTEVYRAEGIEALVTVPLRIRGEIAGTLVFYYRAPRRFSPAEIVVAEALGNLAAAALSAAELYNRERDLREHAQAEERRSSFLATAGETLASSLDYEQTLAKVVDLAVPAFADWASVDIVDAGGNIKRVANKNITPEKIRLGEEYSRKFPPLETDASRIVLRTGRPVWVGDVTAETLTQYARNPEQISMLQELEIKSVILVPLMANERSFGVLSFVTAESGRHYTQSDFALAQEIARRASTAVENARLYTESQRAQEALARSNAELRRANEDLNQFAYSASHDLQEPLRMLVLYSQLLERKYGTKLEKEATEYIGFIAEGARRMDALLGDLLNYMQVVNAAPAVSSPVDASEVLNKVLSYLARSIAESGARIVAGPLPRVRIERIHLTQLFQNIVSNALKYRSERRPEIHIRAVPEGRFWKFCIEDNGIGIARQYWDQVFGMFKRLHDRTRYPGTGIGLAICQKIVDRYGGRIWVESEEGQGSTFYFTVPREIK
jgi:signal transduction histidine kinase